MKQLLSTLVALLLLMSPAAGQGFEIPEGFVVTDRSQDKASPDWQPLSTVQPNDGPFAGLSNILLSKVVTPVDDVDAWLAKRLSAEVADPSEIETFLSSPDSPFSDPAFDAVRRALPELFQGLQKMGELPLEFCDPPTTGYNASGEFRERFCTFAIGPLRKFIVLRLQQTDEGWFYTQISTMNERRLRHLIAIANSFSLTS